MRSLNVRKIRSTFLLLVFGLSAVTEIATANQVDDLGLDSRAIRITVLYDNYSLTEGCRADWGFSCIIMGTEKCILFDTGTNGNLLMENMDKLQVRAQDVDLVVISHHHLDHTGGLGSFLGRNSNVSVYLPPSGPSGTVPGIEATGATAQVVSGPMQICEGVHLTGPLSGPPVEQSLVLETPKGLVAITGCSHPGIVRITEHAKQMLDEDVYFVFGGFHLPNHSDSQVMSIIEQFQQMGIQKVGSTHCTGDGAIALFKQQYREDFVPIGVGVLTIPIDCDLNRDGIVDSADMCIMIDHWHTDEPYCDIAPPLFGDSIVDIQDLIALAKQLFTYPGAVAYWKLDEAEGSVAYDSVADYDGNLIGGPVWQPDGGMVAGALQFDGIDDYVSAGSLLNPADGVFSVLAWIKGGAPAQVILSQAGGTSWLRTDSVEGRLMTELKNPGRGGAPLMSQTCITNGEWHRIGFVWDGSRRSLYVDDIAVAEDTQDSLGGSEDGLHIGTGFGLQPETFWFGLIDDVRIYNRAVTP